MYDTYFLKIDKTRFKQKVLPEILKIKMELTRPIKRGLVEMQGTAYVGDNIATEAHLLHKSLENQNHESAISLY